MTTTEVDHIRFSSGHASECVIDIVYFICKVVDLWWVSFRHGHDTQLNRVSTSLFLAQKERI